ncbi:hypothetical protein [Bacillus sp. JCM 19034]|uniref:hypothetical protein n=1 Tax=Bacillus sp. JCM 19034 TaxID=1481928 RepID=UPI00078224B2|nr:hypothetical protein [Bacillus sp. JCM 19034]
MIQIDQQNNQILSKACLNCQDPHFQPPNPYITKVGCCSYSPTFQLLEISKMCQDDIKQFWEIYQHPATIIRPYTILLQANIDESFQNISCDDFTSLEEEDLKINHSICQLFEIGKGCSLQPKFKNAVCRSFICSTIEEQLTEEEQLTMTSAIKAMHHETREFQKQHSHLLKERSIDLLHNPNEVIQYFQSIK